MRYVYHYLFGKCPVISLTEDAVKVEIPLKYQKHFNGEKHIQGQIDGLKFSLHPFYRIEHVRTKFKHGEIVCAYNRWVNTFIVGRYNVQSDFYCKHAIDTHKDRRIWVEPDQCFPLSQNPYLVKRALVNPQLGDLVGCLREAGEGVITMVTKHNLEVQFRDGVQLFTPDGRYHKGWPKVLYKI
jgi:hypothetical protein